MARAGTAQSLDSVRIVVGVCVVCVVPVVGIVHRMLGRMDVLSVAHAFRIYPPWVFRYPDNQPGDTPKPDGLRI